MTATPGKLPALTTDVRAAAAAAGLTLSLEQAASLR